MFVLIFGTDKNKINKFIQVWIICKEGRELGTSVYALRKNYEDLDYTLQELKDIKYALDQSAIVAITDHRGKIIFANDHFCKVSKYSREELLGQDHRILNSGYHPKTFFKEMWRTIGSGEIWHGDVCNRAKDGSLYWVQTTIVPFLDERGKPYQYISIRVDITEQRNINKIKHLAYHDELTGLPNRRMLNMVLPEKIAQAQQENKKLALVFMDIDRFKNINDSFGHSLGDLFLSEVAKRLSSLALGKNTVYRLSGDEFILLIYDVKEIEQIKSVVTSVIELFKSSFTIDGYEFYASVSLGISFCPDSGLDGETLIKHANRAMFEAKEIPGSTCVFYQATMETDYEQLLMLETKLRRAIDQDLLELYYQPKIDLKTGKMMGMEALIRWFDYELGYIPPNKFIPLAEDRGLINIIGEWTLRTAAKQIKEWESKFDVPLRVAVNISPTHFKEALFVEKIKRIIDETGVNPEYLEIEITENSMMEYTSESIAKLERLQALGITIAIDDFGTGYSSLSYLKKFPINALKIDQSFVRDLLSEGQGTAFIAAIIQLAHALNLHVVAEGVEEKEQLQVLKEHSCDIIQGYYYSKPLPAEEFIHKTKQFIG